MSSTASISITHEPPWLIVRFPAARRIMSWSINRPGMQEGDRVAWLQVRNADLPVGTDPASFLQERLDAHGLGDAIGLMTSSPLERYELGAARVDGVDAVCLVTLGLSNAERIGERRLARPAKPIHEPAVGTINLLCSLSVPLAEHAMLEALSIATQARTTAILSRAYEPVPGAGVVTGTGTDCILIACPTGDPQQPFAGMHTAAGEALGAAVLRVTGAAMDDWLDRHAMPLPGASR